MAPKHYQDFDTLGAEDSVSQFNSRFRKFYRDFNNDRTELATGVRRHHEHAKRKSMRYHNGYYKKGDRRRVADKRATGIPTRRRATLAKAEATSYRNRRSSMKVTKGYVPHNLKYDDQQTGERKRRQAKKMRIVEPSRKIYAIEDATSLGGLETKNFSKVTLHRREQAYGSYNDSETRNKVLLFESIWDDLKRWLQAAQQEIFIFSQHGKRLNYIPLTGYKKFVAGAFYVLSIASLLLLVIGTCDTLGILHPFRGNQSIELTEGTTECSSVLTDWTEWTSCPDFCSFEKSFRTRSSIDQLNDFSPYCPTLDTRDCLGSCRVYSIRYVKPPNSPDWSICLEAFKKKIQEILSISQTRIKIVHHFIPNDDRGSVLIDFYFDNDPTLRGLDSAAAEPHASPQYCTNIHKLREFFERKKFSVDRKPEFFAFMRDNPGCFENLDPSIITHGVNVTEAFYQANTTLSEYILDVPPYYFDVCIHDPL